MGIKKLLLYVTNNLGASRHEAGWDIAFFLINTTALIVGTWYLWHVHEAHWIPFLVIEYTWAIDTMRHNRKKY
jgi:hypothetical protein